MKSNVRVHVYERHRTTLAITDELVTPGPYDKNYLSLAHARDLDAPGVLNRHAAVEMPISSPTGT